ncbi:MAG: leucine-rich repeat domain-containing protein [Microscillaceae bacterium]|nr:leucine-rich repeat domain-containing protein [Microscillaceae bacterium]
MKKYPALSLLMGLFIFFGIDAKAQQNLLNAQQLADSKVFTSLKDALQKPDTVFILNLGGQKLGNFPKEIFQLKKLQQLILYSNQITEIPAEISQLTNLQYLDLYNNQLKDLPTTLAALQNLEYLDLGDNRLKNIPESFFSLPNLKNLFIYGNKLNQIPSRITELANLQTLRLGGGFTFLSGGNRIRKLPDNIGQLNRLKELYLPDNRLRRLPDSFQELDSLRWLDLSNNRFERLPTVLEGLEGLEYLTLWDRGFSQENKESLQAKMPRTTLNFHQDYEGNLWGLMLGFQQGKFSVGELGIVRAFKKDIFVLATAASAEINFNGKMSAAKLSVWGNGLTIFSLGLHGMYYLDESNNSFALRPEVGIGLSMWSVNYGYNILFSKGSQNINKHLVSLRLVVPIAPFFSPFR